jgi:heat shock protein HslJ
MGPPFRIVRRVFSAVLLLAAIFAAKSCSTLPIGRAVEPHAIVVRSQSNADVTTASLRETSKSPDRAVRFALLSPVPAGVSQIYLRPKDPPRFPKAVTLEWIDNQGRFHSRDLSTTGVLRSATGGTDEALVFAIGTDDDVLVFVEEMALSGAAGAEPGIVLKGGPWLLLELKGAVVQLPADERRPFITFQRQEQRVTGYSGCNDFFGNYDLKGDVLTFGPLGMTRRFCAGASGDVEQAFLEVLSKTLRWRIKDRVLLFLSGDQVLARFRQERRENAPR